MEEAQIRTDIPKPLKRRWDQSPRIRQGMKRRIMTVIVHNILQDIEGPGGDKKIGELLEQEIILLGHIAKSAQYAPFRSNKDGID